MTRPLSFFLLLLVAVASADPSALSDVIELLKNLKTKAKQQQEQELALYTKFEHWCGRSTQSLDKAISKEKADIVVREGRISSLTAKIEALTEDLRKLDEKVLKLVGDGETAQSQRDSENNLYQEESASLQSTIKALQDAVALVSKAQSDTNSFVQVKKQVSIVLAMVGQKASPQQRSLLQDVQNQENDPAVDRAGHVKEYSFKSEGVINMLKDLKLKFEDELREKDRLETESKNEFTLQADARAKTKKSTEDLIEEKNLAKEASNAALAGARSDLDNLKVNLATDSESLRDTTISCRTKADEWSERQKIYQQEHQAVDTAISVLAKVTGLRTDAPENPVLPPSPAASFLQIGVNPRVANAVQTLRLEARSVHSRQLEQLAKDVEKHGDGPFDQVVNAIQKMIFQLKDEQTKEDEHKHWCDQEVSKTDNSLDDKNQHLVGLSAEIDAATATQEKLSNDITEDRESVTTWENHMAEATEIRQIGKKENREAIEDAQNTQTAIANAIAVLTEFYKKSGHIPGDSFLQKDPVEVKAVELKVTPETWSASYSGQGSNILVMLETLAADYAKMESTTRAQEDQDQKEFEEVSRQADIEKTRLDEEIERKSQQVTQLKAKERDLRKDHKRVSDEVHYTEVYKKDLEKPCQAATAPNGYDDRKAAREKEIQALGEAQKSLQTAFAKDADASVAETGFLARKRHGSGVVMRPN